MTQQERAFLETEYSCANCGLKGMDHLTIDHIDGRNNLDSARYDNMIVLCHNCHHRKTNEKGITVEMIKKLKQALLIKTLTPYGVNALKLAARNSFGVTATPFLLLHLIEMNLLKETDIISTYGNGVESVTSESKFEITKEGKRIYDKWLK